MTQPRRFRAAALALAALAATAAGSAPIAASAPAAAAPAGCTGPASATWLNVVVDNVRNGNGVIAITLYADDSSKFLVKRGSLYVGRVDATPGTTRGCIFVPKPGVYALGLPAEGYGFSNNPATLAGLPQFRSVRLNVPKPGLTSRIGMKYP
jgi:uncharacterized protein (DUF2141 family)